MKIISALSLVASASAFTSPNLSRTSVSTSFLHANFAEQLPGAIAPTGFFDPLKFSERASNNEMRRYREAEVTHGRVAMLAVLGFLVGEQVQGTTFLFNGQILGPAIDHFFQVPAPLWLGLTYGILLAERFRARKLFVDPDIIPVDRPGIMKIDTIPGDLGFDPLNLAPTEPDEFREMQTKELQNGRLTMIAAAGFLAQEAVDHQGIIEHLTNPSYVSIN